MRIFSFTVFFLSVITSANAATLSWKVEHPFRFLRFASDHKIHELAFEQASKDQNFLHAPVSTMEALLNDLDWWTTPIHHENAYDSPYNQIAAIRRDQEATESNDNRSTLDKVTPEDLRLGWSALLRNQKNGQPADGTCWNIRLQTYSNCISEASGMDGSKNAYVMPKFHYVSVFVDGNTTGENCLFELASASDNPLPDGAVILIESDNRGKADTKGLFPCTVNKVRLKLPFKPNEGKSENAYKFQLDVNSIDENGNKDNRLKLSTNIQTKDYVIVAIGDSFSSGEGNPDVPATLDENLVQKSAFDLKGRELKESGFPRRAGNENSISPNSAAYWIDRRCHRSMYGAPTRAAIALSFAGDRHHAITFINFACSGAEVTDGLLWPQDGQECIQNRTRNSFRFMEPQISGVVRTLALDRGGNEYFGRYDALDTQDRFRRYDLRKNINELRAEKKFCDNWPGRRGNFYKQRPLLHKALLSRKIDVVFMTIGGNDIGFAPLIASATLNDFSKSELVNSVLQKVAREAANGIKYKTAMDRIEKTLPERLELLSTALKRKFELTDNSGRVFVAAYPNLLKINDNEFCAPSETIRNNLGMAVSPFLSFNKPDGEGREIDAIDAQKVVKKLNDTIGSPNGDFIWTFLTSHKVKFEGRAICARDASQTSDNLAENFEVPIKEPSAKPEEWKTSDGTAYNPVKQFRAYEKRQRWFRTYNDAYLAVQVFKDTANDEFDGVRRGRLKAGMYHSLRALGGPFHPTAEGHAAVADAFVKAGMKRLNLSWKQPGRQ